uniref:Uncharacterized protein n=1 Tax=Acrobeloides nanus TaxID=290746 RepID=A0A914DNH4_9BILA
MHPRDRLRFAGTSTNYRKIVDKNYKIFPRESVIALKLDANTSGEAKFELWMRDEKHMDVSNTPNRKFHVPKSSLRLVLAGFQVQKCLKLQIYDTVRSYNEVVDIVSETASSITQLELELSHAYSHIRIRKNNKKLSTKHLEEFASKFPNLSSINLSGWTRDITGNGLAIVRQMKCCHRVDIDSSLRISFNDKALDVIAKKSSKKDPIKEVIMYGPTHKFSLNALISFLQNGNFEDRANLHLSIVNATLTQVREALFNRPIDSLVVEKGGDDDDFYIYKGKDKYYLWVEVNEHGEDSSDSD